MSWPARYHEEIVEAARVLDLSVLEASEVVRKYGVQAAGARIAPSQRGVQADYRQRADCARAPRAINGQDRGGRMALLHRCEVVSGTRRRPWCRTQVPEKSLTRHDHLVR